MESAISVLQPAHPGRAPEPWPKSRVGEGASSQGTLRNRRNPVCENPQVFPLGYPITAGGNTELHSNGGKTWAIEDRRQSRPF